MTKDTLLNSASQLKQIESGFAEEYSLKQEQLVGKVNQVMTARPDIEDLVGGEKNLQMMKDNHGNHARFVVSILKYHDPEVLVDTVLWVFRSYRSRGFHQNYWAAQIAAWITILKEALTPQAYDAIYPLYNWFSVNIPSFTDLSDAQLGDL